jgi:hypothetical protein
MEVHMATVRLLTDDELSPEARAVFDDIRAVRKTEFVNNFWRALAHVRSRSSARGRASSR